MPWYVYTIVPIALITIVVGLMFALRTRFAMAKQFSEANVTIFRNLRDWLREISFFRLRMAMRDGIRALRQSSESKNYRYEKPWYLLLGSEKSGKTELLRAITNSSADSDNHEVNFGVFKNGTVLDCAGKYFTPSTSESEPHLHYLSTRGWRKFQRLLRVHRERRPLDGIVLTINIGELLHIGDSESSNAHIDRMKQMGETLRSLCANSGMRLPVYIVFTFCDTLANFSSLYHALPEERRQDLIGWSSPLSPDASYESNWVDDSFDTILSKISALQFEVMKHAQTSQELLDDVYDVYSTLKDLCPRVKMSLDSLFSAQPDSNFFFLRSMYFIGQESVTAPEESSPLSSQQGLSPFELAATTSVAGPSTAKKQGMFLTGLLSQKVFREKGIATPLAGYHIRRSRMSIAVHIFCIALLVFWTVGLALTVKELQRKRVNLNALVQSMRSDALNSQSSFGVSNSSHHYAVATAKYLKMFSEIEHNRLLSYYIPASWPGFLHRNIRFTLAQEVKKVIIEGMNEEFDRRAQSLTDVNRSYLSADTLSLNRLSLQTTPEYVAFRNFVTATNDWSKYATLYNTLADPHTDQRLAQIIKYLYYEDLTSEVQNFESDYKLLSKVRVTSVSFDEARPRFSERASSMAALMTDRIFHANPVVSSINSFKIAYNDARISERDSAVYDDFHIMARNLDNLFYALKSKETDWMSKDKFNHERDCKDMLGDIQKLGGLLGFGLCDSLTLRLESGFANMKSAMLRSSIAMHSGLSDSSYFLIVSPETNRLAPTPAIENVYAALCDWKKQSFVVPSSKVDRLADKATAMNFNKRIMWNSALVKTIPSTIESYTAYLSTGIDKFPLELQVPAERVVRNGVHKTIADIVERAAETTSASSSRSEAEMTLEVSAFQESSSNLQLALNQLNATEDGSGRALSTLLGKQITGILRSMKSLLENRHAYSTTIPAQSIDEWKPDQSLLSLMFNVSNPDELAVYLEVQRKSIEDWSKRLASPLCSYYDNNLASTSSTTQDGQEALTFWQKVNKAVDGYVKKEPNNSIGKLEQFIASLSNYNMSSFDSKLMTKPAADSKDYFLTKIRDIGTELRQGLQKNSDARFTKEYNTIYHNTTDIMNLFPFGQSDKDAEVETVKNYYESINAPMMFTRVVKDAGSDNITKEQSYFLSTLLATKEFFRPVIYAGETSTGAYTVSLTFRTNSILERNASAVYGKLATRSKNGALIEKSLLTPGDVVSFQWSPGDDFHFDLHWAKDGNVSPVVGTGYELSNHKTVSFTQKGLWSLLRFIRNNQSATLLSSKRMQLCLKVNTDKGLGSNQGEPGMVLYMDVDIVPRSKDIALTIPLLTTPPLPK